MAVHDGQMHLATHVGPTTPGRGSGTWGMTTFFQIVRLNGVFLMVTISALFVSSRGFTTTLGPWKGKGEVHLVKRAKSTKHFKETKQRKCDDSALLDVSLGVRDLRPVTQRAVSAPPQPPELLC